MINVQNLVQTRAFARQDGAILGLVWIVSFAFTMLAVKPDQSFLGLIGNLLLISTPFVVGKRLKSFRDYALEGTISFRRGTFYCMQTFFNATLLLTVVQFLWFSFMDMGPFMALLESTYQRDAGSVPSVGGRGKGHHRHHPLDEATGMGFHVYDYRPHRGCGTQPCHRSHHGTTRKYQEHQ